MNILVLGGTQFIGLRVVELLHDGGHRVTVLNRGKTLAELPEGVARLRADRADQAQVRAALRGKQFDAAFHFSGYTPSDVRPVIEELEGNVGHYLFCSSVAVYAPGDVAPIDEDHPLHRAPKAGEYSRDKILCEDLLNAAFQQRDFPVTIVRPPYVYGPKDPQAHVFSTFARLAHGRRVLVPGDGQGFVHMVHVDDLASAFASIPGNRNALGRAYNATGPQAMTVDGLVEMLSEIAGAAESVHVDRGDLQELSKALGETEVSRLLGLGSLWSRVYTNERLRNDTGWSPGHGLRDGLAMTYQWWLDAGMREEAWDFSADDTALDWLQSRSGG